MREEGLDPHPLPPVSVPWFGTTRQSGRAASPHTASFQETISTLQREIMALVPQLWSLSALSVEIGVNVRTLASALRNVPPDGKVTAGRDGWRLLTALRALDVTVPVRGHQLNGGSNGKTDGRSSARLRSQPHRSFTRACGAVAD